MSVEFWKNAELFYETLIPIIGITAGVLLMIMQYTHMYARGKAKKKIFTTSVLLLVLLAGYGTWGYVHYEAYLPKSKITTPLIRDRKKGIFGYKYYSWDEMRTYTHLNGAEKIRKLGLYEETKVEEPIVYLGKGHYYHFFEDKNQKVFKLEKEVHFEKDTKQAEIMGSTFHLKSKEYEELGFFNPKKIMYQSVTIPLSEQGKVFDKEYEPQVPMARDRFAHWNF